jgi:hypothetical protein
MQIIYQSNGFCHTKLTLLLLAWRKNCRSSWNKAQKKSGNGIYNLDPINSTLARHFKESISVASSKSTFARHDLIEWGWTARNAIARQSFARHFWQQINCSTQILTTARIQLILAKPDSSKWQKKWQLLDSVEQCKM